MRIVREQEYTFVTNNRADFLALHGKEPLHAGVIIIVPNVTPTKQRALFQVALDHIDRRDLTNTVLEVQFEDGRTRCSEYELPPSDKEG